MNRQQILENEKQSMMGRLMSYFNTTKLNGPCLKEYKKIADSQNDIILNFFSDTDESYTPFEVQALVLPNAPVTSVRRSITNLTNAGYLVKTSELRKGQYKRLNHCWTWSGYFD